MNICMTSTFEGTFDDFNNMMGKIRAAFPGISDATESAEVPMTKKDGAGLLQLQTL